MFQILLCKGETDILIFVNGQKMTNFQMWCGILYSLLQLYYDKSTKSCVLPCHIFLFIFLYNLLMQLSACLAKFNAFYCSVCLIHPCVDLRHYFKYIHDIDDILASIHMLYVRILYQPFSVAKQQQWIVSEKDPSTNIMEYSNII